MIPPSVNLVNRTDSIVHKSHRKCCHKNQSMKSCLKFERSETFQTDSCTSVHEFGKSLTERRKTANGLSDSTFELLIDSSMLEHSHLSGPLGGAVKDRQSWAEVHFVAVRTSGDASGSKYVLLITLITALTYPSVPIKGDSEPACAIPGPSIALFTPVYSWQWHVKTCFVKKPISASVYNASAERYWHCNWERCGICTLAMESSTGHWQFPV